jgi:hypothetical protein
VSIIYNGYTFPVEVISNATNECDKGEENKMLAMFSIDSIMRSNIPLVLCKDSKVSFLLNIVKVVAEHFSVDADDVLKQYIEYAVVQNVGKITFLDGSVLK